MTREILGATLIATPFAAFFAYGVYDVGLFKTLAAFAISVVVVSIIAVGCYILGNKS
jgi:hypothetical protein